MRIETFGLTDIGRVRSGNEDSILVAPEHALVAVCDGMGGHEAGEVASRTGVDALRDWYAQGGDDGATYRLEDTLPSPARRLVSAVFYADQSIRQAAAAVPGRTGMGTTVVAAMVSGDQVYVAHAGDSRAYLSRGRGLVQITIDHSVVNDLLRAGVITAAQAVNVKKNAITRALGVTDNLVVDIDRVDLRPGDCVLLCSDGLHGLVSDQVIGSLVCGDQTLEDACRALIDAANQAGGNDNISAVLLRAAG